MRALQFAVALSIGVAVPLAAQQLAGPQQPTERLLILPFMASPADSAASIALADAVRDRVNSLVKSKVMVVPKAKLCEALAQSGFSCNGLLDDQQAKQLAHFLQVHSYVTGSFAKSGSNLTGDVQMIDIGSSGMSGRFNATNGNPGTTLALAETIAQHIASVVRISEPIRNCNDERKKGNFSRARSEAQKALTVDPNSTGAWLCISTIYEAMRLPIDSQIAANERALKSDSLNGTALENLAQLNMRRNDTLTAMKFYIRQLGGEPRNTQRRLGVVLQLRQMKQYPLASQVIDDGLKVQPGDMQLLDMKLTICTEANNYACESEVWLAKAKADSTVLADTTNVKAAIGAGQQASDTAALDFFTAAAYRRFPNNVSFIKARAGALELAGKTDSAMAYYRKALALQPNDATTSLQIAKEIVDRATYDTAQARHLREAKDTSGLRMLQQALAAKIDSAKTFLKPGLASPDSTQRLAANVIMLTAGSKLAQAAAYPAAYEWLDSLLLIIGYTPRTPADTLGPKHQVRINASFWYGLSSILTLQPEYKRMSETKGAARCPTAHAVFDRLSRTKEALQLGHRVHPPTVDQMLGFVAQYEKAKANVQAAFKCKPPL